MNSAPPAIGLAFNTIPEFVTSPRPQRVSAKTFIMTTNLTVNQPVSVAPVDGVHLLVPEFTWNPVSDEFRSSLNS